MDVAKRGKPRLSAERRAEIRSRFRVANSNLKWFAEHYPTIRKRHAGRVVVVWKGDVVATGKSIPSATTAAKKKHVPVADALIQYVPGKDETLVL